MLKKKQWTVAAEKYISPAGKQNRTRLPETFFRKKKQ